MKKVVCSVFDAKAAAFSLPYYSVNLAVAMRDFRQGCLDPDSALSRNPEDFSLFHLANFDDETGLFTTITPPAILTNASVSIQGE